MAQNSSDIQNKTPKAENKTTDADSKYNKEAQQIVEQTGERNVLNSYRSITYNFTLAGLKKEYLKDPNKLLESELELVILKSGGKGTRGVVGTGANPDDIRKAGQETYDKFDAQAKRDAQAKVDASNKNLDIIDGFNKDSPGRFDLFMENVEIETLMSFSKDSNLSMPTKLKFEVLEPYSMNGFIEALYVASLAAGYPSYLQASFVLKVEFWGYPDNDLQDFQNPVKIPQSERYFPIGLTNIEVEITERGTKYRCEAVPFNERAFGQPNSIKKPIKMEGDTVGSILKNFIKNVNDQAVQQFKEAKQNGNPNQVDTYDIKFVEWDENEAWVEKPNSIIASKKLVELMKDNALYGMVDPGNSTKGTAYKEQGKQQPSAQEQAKQPESIKYIPNKTVVQFAEGMNIHDIITAVIRDSEYIRDILKDVKKHTDPYGMIDYFQVRIETINTDIINDDTKKPVQKFIYVIGPYKIHYSKIPNLGDRIINEKELKKLSRREYNYIYTGQNVDVLNFKLNFNTLFFEAVPAAMGNKDQPEAKTGVTNDNNVKAQQKSTDNAESSKSQIPLHPKKIVTTQIQSYGGNASQPLDDPYSVLARNMHSAVTNSMASMLTGELEILGDPFYLVTGGMGNYNPKPEGPGKVKGGQAAHNQQQTMITINFRNPIDILPFEQGGMMFFDGNRVPFSGVYMITSVTNTFKDGIFKQRLQVVRVPGQVLDYNVKATDINDYIVSVPDPDDAVREDPSRNASPSQRADSDSLSTMLDRSIPSVGLPGEPNNFTAQPGGLGGSDMTFQNRTYGLIGRDGGLFAGSSVVGKSLPTDFSANVRLNSSGLAALNQTNLGSAALIAVAANVLTGNIPAKRAIGAAAGVLFGGAVASAMKKSNVGSGIGEGATLSVPSLTSIAKDPVKFGNTIDTSGLSAGSISSTVDSLKQYGSKAVDSVVGLGAGVGALVGDAGNKLKSLTGSKSDPQAIAAQVGLDSSKLSGLDKNLQSNVLKQVSSYVGKTPADTNLTQAVNQGLVLNYIPSSKVANIPATSPYSVAPLPEPDAALSSQTPQSVNNPLKGITGRLNIADVRSAGDKLLTAKSQLSSLTGTPNLPDKGILGSVSEKFGSNSLNSPLDKLVNGLKNNLG